MEWWLKWGHRPLVVFLTQRDVCKGGNNKEGIWFVFSICSRSCLWCKRLQCVDWCHFRLSFYLPLSFVTLSFAVVLLYVGICLKLGWDAVEMVRFHGGFVEFTSGVAAWVRVSLHENPFITHCRTEQVPGPEPFCWKTSQNNMQLLLNHPLWLMTCSFPSLARAVTFSLKFQNPFE